MNFKVGNKVKVKEKSISKFPASLVRRIKHGGTIIDLTSLRGFPLVDFGDGVEYFFWKSDLELTFIKNQQLLFDFME